MTDSANENSAQIDHCCDLFEKHWGTEKAFSIEDVLSKLPESQHAVYLKALLPLEIELAGKNAQSAEQLQTRFANLKNVVDGVLSSPPPDDSLAGTPKSQQETIAPRDQTDDHDGHSGSGQMRIPRKLGRYRIVRKLGHGAMGSVFLAHDEQLDRQVALKIPRGDMQRNRELRMRFQREAQAAASLDHPNICRIFDISEFEGIHYICMGYVEGFPLSRYAIAQSGLTEQRIAELVLKLAKALAHAHEAGFIHRDLKPANVMMDHDDEPVILDFGLARRVDRNEDLRVTQTGENVGSPAYMSPEQVDGDQEKVGPQSDVYSLGVILYELLTGRLPFEGSVAAVMGQIMTKEPDKPSEFRKDLSVRLENICLRMMAKDREQRHPSMHAVVAGLQEYLEKYASRSTPEESSVEKTDDGAAKRRQQIEGLIKSGDYAQAEKLMVSLSRETDDALVDAAAWAAAELPQLRKTREEVRAGRQEMYNTASRLMRAYDYEQAAQLLGEYPYDLRTPKMQELLERAEQKADEVKQLRKQIKTLRGRADNKAIVPVLQTLLELKPGDRRAKELLERLASRSSGPITKVLGGHTPGFLEKLSAATQTAVLAFIVIIPSSVVGYQWATTFLDSISGRGNEIVSGDGTAEDSVSNNTVDGTATDAASSDGDDVSDDGMVNSRFQPAAAFGNARPLRNLNDFGSVNAYPCISPDGLTIWWTREGDNEVSSIYQATRNAITDPFGNVTLALSEARHGALTADGLKMIALARDSGGRLLSPRFFQRISSAGSFSVSEEAPAIGKQANPRSFAFSNRDLDLIYSDRSAGYELFRISRSTSGGPWGTPETIRTEAASSSSGTLFGWGSLTTDQQFLIHTQADEANLRKERAYLSIRKPDGNYGSPEAISISGDSDLPVRSPRFCEATGELFYTLGTGPLNSPFSKAELWVANVESATSTPETRLTNDTPTTQQSELTVRQTHSFESSEAAVLETEVDASEQLIAVGARNGHVYVHDADTYERVATFNPSKGLVIDLAFHPTQSLLASASYPKVLTVYDATTEKEIWQTNTPAAPTRVEYSTDGSKLVTVDWDGKAIVYDAGTGAPITTLSVEGETIGNAVFSQDGRYVYAANFVRPPTEGNSKLYKIDIQSGEVVSILGEHPNGEVDRIRLSPTGTKLASLDRQGNVKLWGLANEKILKEWKLDMEKPHKLAFFDDRTLLVGGAAKLMVVKWYSPEPVVTVDTEKGINALHAMPKRSALVSTVGKTTFVYDIEDPTKLPSQSRPATAETPPTLSTASQQTEWTSLLNGSLDERWQRYSGGAISSRWNLVNGELTLRATGNKDKGGTEGIVTKASYRDFELEFEWKVSPGANGGIVYLAQMGLDRAYKSGPEYQILDDIAKRSVTSTKTVSGSIYGLAPVTGTRPKPVGQWNTGKIIKQGSRLTHWLNGVKAASIVVDSPEWRRSVAQREMKKWPHFCRVDSGRIELQDHGGGVSFRNLRVRKLPSQPIDLISFIQPARDVVSGEFQVSNGKLLTPPNSRAANHTPLLMLPYVPQSSYKLHLEIERKSDSGYGCNIGIVVGGRQTAVVMDGGAKVAWAMENIDGHSMHDAENKTTVRGKRLQLGKVVPVDIDVTDNSVSVNVAGQRIINWTGRPDQLSVWNKVAPKLTSQRQLFLFSQAEFLIHKLELTPGN